MYLHTNHLDSMLSLDQTILHLAQFVGIADGRLELSGISKKAPLTPGSALSEGVTQRDDTQPYLYRRTREEASWNV